MKNVSVGVLESVNSINQLTSQLKTKQERKIKT